MWFLEKGLAASGVRGPTQLELRFLERVAEIRGVGARESGDVAFLSRMTVQANLPYRDPGRSFYERRNGRVVLTLQAPPAIGRKSSPRPVSTTPIGLR
jgi:hypothetical protein